MWFRGQPLRSVRWPVKFIRQTLPNEPGPLFPHQISLPLVAAVKSRFVDHFLGTRPVALVMEVADFQVACCYLVLLASTKKLFQDIIDFPSKKRDQAFNH